MGVDEKDPKTDLRAKCLQVLMGLKFPVNDPATPLTLTGYSNFMNVFRPLRTGKEGPTFLDSIVDLCSKDWYYGQASRAQAEGQLNDALQNHGNKSPFLVRNSENEGFKFCISYVATKATKVEHVLIQPEAYQSEGITAYLTNEVTKKHLKPVKGIGRPFTLLFDSSFELLEQKRTAVGDQSGYEGQSSFASVSNVGFGKVIT